MTELGEVPVDWEVKSLAEISTKIMVGIASAATHAYRKSGVPLIRNQNIKGGKLDDSDMLYISTDYEETFQNKRLRTGDLITARTGYPGATCLVPAHYEKAQSFTTLITRLNKEMANPEFVNHFINSNLGQDFFTVNQIGGGQKNVNAGALHGLNIPFPPTKEEQHAIATALSDTDALMQGLEALIQKKQQLRQAVMQELLTGKRRLAGTKQTGFKKTELGEIPEDWELIQLEQLTNKIGSGITPKGGSSRYKSIGRPFVRSQNVGWGTLLLRDLVFIDEETHQEFESSELEKSDVLLNITGASIGRSAIVSEVLIGGNVNQHVCIIRPNMERVTAELINLFLISELGQNQIQSFQAGGNREGLNFGQIRSLLMPIPPSIEEQKVISESLNDLASEIESLNQKLQKIKKIKAAQMQELLTGKTRLI